MPDDCKKVRLFHQIWEWDIEKREAVLASIQEQGLIAKQNGCGEGEPYPPRRLVVYGLDDIAIESYAQETAEMLTWSDEAQERLAETRGQPIAQVREEALDTPVIEFEVCQDDVMVGDLTQECRPTYLKEMTTYKDFYEKTNPPGGVYPPTRDNPGYRGRWREIEFFVPGPEIPLNQFVSIRRLRDYL